MTRADYGENFTKWDADFEAAQALTDVPASLIKAICMNESSLGLDPRVAKGLIDPNDVEGSKSEDGLSWGLMQLTLPAARDFDLIASPQKLNNPEYSIHTASLLLRRLSKQFLGVEEWMVKAYNQGAGATMREKNGTDHGRADDYWEKYQAHREVL